VFPPTKDNSYWLPYGDRAVVALTFPVLYRELWPSTLIETPIKVNYGPLRKRSYAQPEAPIVYGPPPAPAPLPKLQPDIGVIISQNYVLKENFRDYYKLSTADPVRPTDEELGEFAQSYQRSAGAHDAFQKTSYPKPESSFVTIALESRLKTNTPTKDGFKGSEKVVFHNGTIIFPAPGHPGLLTRVPFELKSPEDVHSVFDGYGENDEGFVPRDKFEIVSFLKLMCGLHEDTYEEGRQAVERYSYS
jgi:hypothetical protein